MDTLDCIQVFVNSPTNVFNNKIHVIQCALIRLLKLKVFVFTLQLHDKQTNKQTRIKFVDNILKHVSEFDICTNSLIRRKRSSSMVRLAIFSMIFCNKMCCLQLYPFIVNYQQQVNDQWKKITFKKWREREREKSQKYLNSFDSVNECITKTRNFSIVRKSVMNRHKISILWVSRTRISDEKVKRKKDKSVGKVLVESVL